MKPVEPHGMTPTSKFQKDPNVAWKQNHIVLCLFFFVVFFGFFCLPKFSQVHFQQKTTKFIFARIGGEVSGVALRDVQRFCPRGSQFWDPMT